MLRIAFALLLILLGARAVSAPPQQGIAIVGANVLPMTGRDRLTDQTVLIAGDRITRVGPRRSVRIPPGYRRINARGQTLMPGLVDMHVHLPGDEGKPGGAAQRALAVMLAHGVTTARGMAGSPNNLLVRSAIERGEVIGPRYYAASPPVSINNSKTAEAARDKVAAAKAAGYDLIKSHHLPDPAVWQALQDEARKQGLPTAGHVANEVGVLRAAAAGQQIEHLDGIPHALLPQGAAERALDFGQIPPREVLDALASVSDAQFRALAVKLAAARSFHVPTLALFEKLAAVDVTTEELMARPEMRFVPPATLQQWANQREQLTKTLTAEDGRKLRDLRRRLVRALHRARVPIMPGSDTAQLFHLWGPGLIEEIEAFGASGMTPMDALRSATVVPRDYFRSLPNGGSSLGWKADFGTIEADARADLILLSRDPSRDLSALRSLETVVAAGRVYDRPALDAMLAKAAADAKAAAAPAPPAAAAAFPALPSSVYVMRHLEKADGPDPALSAVGAANARRLADWFKEERPAAIYASSTRRAQESAAPLAARLGLTVKSYDPSNTAALIEALAKEKGPVLVVGHSNTVPEIVERLGGARPAPLDEGMYGDIWHVGGPRRTVTRHRLGGK